MNVITQTEPVDGRGPCYRHPDVETGLRCSNVVDGKVCNCRICPKCAVPTRVGYKCPECIREIGDRRWTGKWSDYLVASGITVPLSLLTALGFRLVIALAGWFPWYIVLLAAPAIARFIGDAVHWGVRKRRSRYLKYVVAGSFAATILPFLAVSTLAPVLSSDLSRGVLGSGLIELGILLVAGEGAILAQWR
jgi:hypothetical protein